MTLSLFYLKIESYPQKKLLIIQFSHGHDIKPLYEVLESQYQSAHHISFIPTLQVAVGIYMIWILNISIALSLL